VDRFRFPETFTLDDDGVEKSSIKTVLALLLAEHFERRKINLFSSAPDMKASSRIFLRLQLSAQSTKIRNENKHKIIGFFFFFQILNFVINSVTLSHL